MHGEQNEQLIVHSLTILGEDDTYHWQNGKKITSLGLKIDCPGTMQRCRYQGQSQSPYQQSK